MARRGPLFILALLAALGMTLPACGPSPKPAPKPPAKSAAKPYKGPLPALRAVQFVTPRLGFLGGQGIVLETRDGGRTFTRIYSGAEDIAELDFTSPDAGWVRTASGEVLAFDGKRFRRIASSLGAAAAIHLGKGGPSLVLTKSGTLYRAKGPEGPWQSEGVGLLSSIAFAAGGRVGWAVGTSAGAPVVYVTADGGRTWAKSFAPPVEPDQDWSATLGAAGGAVWLLLTSPNGQMEHQPYVAFVRRGKGSPWTEVLAASPFAGAQGFYPPTRAGLYGLQAGPLAARGPAAAFLSWLPAPNGNLLALTTSEDVGRTWSQRPLALKAARTPNFFQPMGLALVGRETLWLVGSRGGKGIALTSNDGGAHFSSPSL